MKKTKVLGLIKGNKPDYLADMLWIALAADTSIDFTSNIYPDFLFKIEDDSNSQKRTKTFTLYNKLDAILKKRNSNEKDLLKLIETKQFDLIIYLSIRRFDKYFEDSLRLYGNNKVISIDGEDDQCISINHAMKSIYFKRELLNFFEKESIKPISFFLPKIIIKSTEELIDIGHQKRNILAHCDPRDTNTYIFNQEKDYYNQYAISYFGFTKMKGGWDCLRHYEIIASKSVPFFELIERKPDTTMNSYPIKLQRSANKLYSSLTKEGANDSNIEYYKIIQKQFYEWLKEESSIKRKLKLDTLIRNNKTHTQFISSRNLKRFIILNIYNFIAILFWSWNQRNHGSSKSIGPYMTFLKLLYHRFTYKIK